MTEYDHDAVVDLADRARAVSEFQFAIEWAGLTGEEQAAFMALMDQRCARGEEKLEAIAEGNRLLIALAMLVVRSDAPLGTGLGEALTAGYIGPLDVIETIRSADAELI